MIILIMLFFIFTLCILIIYNIHLKKREEIIQRINKKYSDYIKQNTKSEDNHRTVIIPDEIDKKSGKADTIKKVDIYITDVHMKKEVIENEKNFNNDEYNTNDNYNFENNSDDEPIKEYNPVKKFLKL